jgi:hypothetical protein
MSSPRSVASVTSVGIRPNSSILSVLSHLNYKAWYAVAEFVDNSIQSYLASREQLRALHGEDYKLKIRVWLDQANNRIEITDNAAGIKGEDYPRAFRPAEVPPDRSGLSEFGMGMKTAACWFTNKWSVSSKALGEPVERIIHFDLNEILSGKLDELRVVETPAKPDDHYTVLRLESLGKKFPVKRTHSKLRDHLTSIYRMYLRGGEIEIYFDEDKLPLKFPEPDVLFVPPQATPTAPPVLWRKDVDITLSGGRRVHGFAAIRKEASTTHAGFALFRRNRLILGSDDETYRPQAIFGNSNSFRYQRIFGELNVEGFEVSHTKDGFRWDDLEDEMLERLRDRLREGVDLLKQADNYRARPSKAALQPTLTRAGESIKQDLQQTGSAALTMRGIAKGMLDEQLRRPPEPALVAAEQVYEFLVDGQEWRVRVRSSVDPAAQDWLRLSHSVPPQGNILSDRELTVDVSMTHPFVQQFIGPKNENAELFLRLAVAVGLAFEKSERGGNPTRFALYWLNKLMKETLSRGES